MIHFELNIAYGMRWGYNFIFCMWMCNSPTTSIIFYKDNGRYWSENVYIFQCFLSFEKGKDLFYWFIIKISSKLL